MIKEYLADERNIVTRVEPVSVVRKYVECKDGTCFSVQASQFHYCFPRETRFDGEYDCVEVKSYTDEEELRPYLGDESYNIYFYVPVEVVDKVIEKHGGII